jgi:pimeloyl-ACP methyl ester carboxylesterase
MPPVLLVPGITNPVELSYGPLIEVLRGNTRLVLKELEVYRGSIPPVDYIPFTEAEGIRRAADEAGLGTFHLVGYSAGGLAALAAIELIPERLRSVTLIEPFGTGSYDTSPEERTFLDRTATVIDLPDDQRVAAFLPMNLRDGVEPPPPVPGPVPEWMSLRPAGISALIRAAIAVRFDTAALATFDEPVYIVYGSLSHPAWQAMADALTGLFPDTKVEVYEGLHHLTPPQRTRPVQFAPALHTLWAEVDTPVDAR